MSNGAPYLTQWNKRRGIINFSAASLGILHAQANGQF